MYQILTLNNISPKGLKQFSKERYQLGNNITDPDAVLLRSFDLHDFVIPASVQVVGRAGVGVNNIPVAKFTELGVPVLNTPGANANAVKELVITGMLLAARNICSAWDYTRHLVGDDQSIHEQVEKNKKQFSGFELPGKTLGVIGLGNIGVKVANTALDLGMQVIGYDPSVTVKHAWQLSSDVQHAEYLEEALKHSDFVTLHVPLNKHTENLLDARRLQLMPEGSVLINLAREGIVDNAALLDALNSGKLRYYVCDFPSAQFKNHPRVICLPHLGASTQEAEENCAMMVAEQVRHFLEDGDIKYSINFPEIKMSRNGGNRLAIVNRNVPNMVAQISQVLSKHDINIIDMINKSRDNIAYTLIDINTAVTDHLLKELKNIAGVVNARAL